MSLLDPMLVFELTPAEAEIFERPIVGDGGQQDLLRTLHAHYDRRTRRLEVEVVDLQKVERYAYAHEGGGHQDRFKAVLRAAWREGWK